MQKQHRTLRINDELWEQVRKKSSQEQMNISEWIRVVLSKAINCSSLGDIGDINQKTELKEIHKTVDMIWGFAKYQIENNGKHIPYNLLKKAVDEKYLKE